MSQVLRIKKIVGQINSLAKSIEQGGKKCDAVLQQVSAVQGALSSLKKEIIQSSLEQCAQSQNANMRTQNLLKKVAKYI